jgi:hypothetical protein
MKERLSKVKKRIILVVFVVIGIVCSTMFVTTLNAASTIYYVTPTGVSTNGGTSFCDAFDISTAVSKAVAGDTILLKSGTYIIPYVEGAKNTINLSSSGAQGNEITIKSVGPKPAVLDFSFPELMWVQNSFGLYITGSYWSLKGIDITHAGYQGVYITGANNKLENCRFYDNRNTGVEINKGGSYTTLINCDAFKNYDPKKLGSMADGFGPKQTMGPGNKFIGCRAWENSDDGFDCFDSPEIVTFENCWAFRNGVDVWGYGDFSGNGNGFKIGGNYQQANHKLNNCIAFGQPKKGFDQNNNSGGLTIYNCVSYANGINYGLGNNLNEGQQHILKNNISLDGVDADTIKNADESNNTWDTGFTVSSADFKSLDLQLATVLRTPNGSIPENKLFRLTPNSQLIDKGIDVGLKFKGIAPDLGAFELR